MFSSETILVGLELGTSKTCVVVSELASDGELTILGVGQARSRGVRKGEIIDAEKAGEDAREALGQAEEMADVEIENVYLAVTGNHFRSVNNRSVHTILSVDREITEEDVQDALSLAKNIDCPPGYEVIDSVRQDFVIDEHAVFENPVGIVGSRIDACVHLIQGNSNRIATSRRVVESATPMRVEKPVFSGLASALAVLSPEHKERGAIVIDFGAGTTEFAFFHKGLLRHSGVLAVGGDHVTNDLASGLRVPLGFAERIKMDYGAATLEIPGGEQTIPRPVARGDDDQGIRVELLRRLMILRLEETLEIISNRLAQVGALRLASAGVHLTGGGCRVPGMEALVSQIFRLPVQMGRTHEISGPAEAIENPEFATPIGLARYAAIRSRKPRTFWPRLLPSLGRRRLF